MKNPVTIDVHIGTAKTGTTSIQHYLQVNRRTLLRDYGICYPRSLGKRLSSNLAAACQRSEKPDDLRRVLELDTPAVVEAYYKRLRSDFAREVARSGARRVLISSEHLSSRLKSDDDLQRLRDFLLGVSDNIRVHIYLRRQDELLISLYSTSIKSGETRPFFFPAPGKARHDFYYNEMLDRWVKHFDKVSVGLFERSRLRSQDVVADFCSRLEVPCDLPGPKEDDNVSLNAQTLEFLREFNELVPRFIDGRLNPLRGDIVRALEILDMPGENFRATGGSRKFFKQFESGNREVARRWFAADHSIPDTLFEPPGSELDMPPPQLPSGQQMVQVAAHLWARSQSQLQAQMSLHNARGWTRLRRLAGLLLKRR